MSLKLNTITLKSYAFHLTSEHLQFSHEISKGTFMFHFGSEITAACISNRPNRSRLKPFL